ncbi:MAG TPA: glycoside hydrolase family 1 protein [Candidatus Tetragenococcus pullicola]|nr:glycoside hydrolase family 1 protein [Candidatus Tetragenococcus pullicola]
MTKFLWGSATASYQCEGAWNEDGRVPSLWDVYLHENQLEDGDVASDFYHHYKEDIRLMKEGGQTSYRFSISWSRVITDKFGTINPKGIAFYQRVIEECLKNDIEPFVTIFHWDLPDYLEKEGGWLNRSTVDAYLNLCRVLFDKFGDKVRLWATFNEPRYYVFSGYFIGNYPPAVHDAQKTAQASYYMMLANAKAIQLYRKMKQTGEIGIVHSYGPIYGVDDSSETKQAMRDADNYYNNWVLDPAILGIFPKDLLEKLISSGIDLSFIQENDSQIFKENTVDFIGLNYYARVIIAPYKEGETVLSVNNSGKSAKGSSKIVVKDWFEQLFDLPDAEYTDWDVEIFPQGLYEGILMVHEKYNIPIYITENGVGVYEDVDHPIEDNYRIEFLNDHIDAILRSKKDGADVRGYYVWSTMDLYSWKNGTEKRYGLVAVDFNNQCSRKPKKSYYWYKKVCDSNGKEIQQNRKYKSKGISTLSLIRGEKDELL